MQPVWTITYSLHTATSSTLTRVPEPAGKVWIDGAPIDADSARVPVFDRGFLYGDSVYEVLRTFSGKPFGLAEHLDRMERSAAALLMRLPSRGEIERAIAETLAACGAPDAYIRIVVTRGAGDLGLDPSLADQPRLIVIARPVKLPDPAHYAEGVEVAIVSRSRTAAPGQPGALDPQVKSGNYLVSVLALAEARRRGAYEAILTDSVGRITEGGSSNFFLVRGGRISTPPVSAGLLEGITRGKVIGAAREAGLFVDELPLWPVDLHRADEAFLTSSVRGILPIVRVDGDAVGAGKPGPITRQVMSLYDELTG
jgi:branched-chain amino acid aminotransferase